MKVIYERLHKVNTSTTQDTVTVSTVLCHHHPLWRLCRDSTEGRNAISDQGVILEPAIIIGSVTYHVSQGI
jgi:hypothetical protein